MPQPVIARLNAEMQKTARTPDVAKKIEADGGYMVGSTPAQFREVLTAEVTRYRNIARENGITLVE